MRVATICNLLVAYCLPHDYVNGNQEVAYD